MDQCGPLIFLRDPFTSALLASLCDDTVADAREPHRRVVHRAQANGTLVSYVLSELTTATVVALDRVGRFCAIPPVFLGVLNGTSFFLAVPLPDATFAGATLVWALYAQSEATRQYIARCRIAQLQTIGGGWASLCRADKALLCAVALYYLATEVVHDDDIASKSRLFIGWAHLWNGNVPKALALFDLELQNALSRDDLIHERRCRHAIINATTNAQLLRSLRRGAFSLTDCWTTAFTATEMRDVHDMAASIEASQRQPCL